MFMYVTFAVNAMRIFGNNRKIIGNNWTISQELWNRIIGKILSIIASGLGGGLHVRGVATSADSVYTDTWLGD